MSKRYLSGEELLQQMKQQVELPQRGGFKEFEPDGSWLQNKRLDSFYRERREVLQEERVQKISSLSLGEWDENECKVLVKKSGKFWKNMGHVEDGKQWLYPEEALFLIDEGVMEVYHGGIPLSMEEAFSLLLRSEVPVEHYQAFAHLSRLGYIVRRHRKISCVTTYEKLIDLDRPASACNSHRTKKRKHKLNSADVVNGKKCKPDDTEQISSVESEPCSKVLPGLVKLENSEIGANSETADSSGENLSSGSDETRETLPSEAADDCIADDVVRGISCLPGGGYSMPEREIDGGDKTLSRPGSGVCYDERRNCAVVANPKCLSAKDPKPHPCFTWDFSSIKFPDISAGTAIEMVLEPPPGHLLPPGIEMSKPLYTIDLRPYRRLPDQRYSMLQEPVLKVTTVQPSAKNWTEYKRMLADEMEDESLASSPASVLWTGDVTPLLKPWQASSTRAVLSRLRIVENFELSDFNESVDRQEIDDDRQSPFIVYDVYLPDAKFRKSDPGIPAVCLCINRQDEKMPSFSTLHCLQLELPCPSGMTLMWAVVDNGDVAFYSFNNVNLPTDHTFP